MPSATRSASRRCEADELNVVAPESGLKLDGSIDMTELVKASTPAKEPKFYTVKKGDNLSKIAEEAYGKGKARSTPSSSRPTSRC